MLFAQYLVGRDLSGIWHKYFLMAIGICLKGFGINHAVLR